MKNLSFLSVLVLLTLFICSCKKKDNNYPDDGKYPLNNFQSVITNQRIVVNGTAMVTCDVKNISQKDYLLRDNTAHPVGVKVTMTATDASVYSMSVFLNDLLTGQTAALEIPVEYTSGKTPDFSKTKLEVYYRN